MSGPLADVRIIDLSNVVSGPMAVQLLADQGADVIKVEQPGGGDISRQMGAMRNGTAALFAVLNRNKRSIVIDTHQESGRSLLLDLVRTADVVVQNFRPGAMDRMGIGYSDLRAVREDLIYASISGFGSDGPYAARRVYDPVIQGITGFVDVQTGRGAQRPELVKNIVCDKATALNAAQAITAALYARERGAGGQALEVAMMDVGLAFLWPDGMWPDGMWNNTLLGEGVRPMPSLADIYRVARTLDGSITYLTVSDDEWRGMCRAIDRADLAEDPRYATLVARISNIDEMVDLLDDELVKWKTDEICARLDAEDVPFARVCKLDEVHTDPQIVHRESLIEAEHPSGGPLRMPRPTARFESTPSEVRFMAPELGEHTDEILRELGHNDASIEQLRGAGSVS
ncbi:MAG: CoA transferase [Gammaproteobacteria bacterium]|nr:CoA transferase [Gammaproteobacteria bacterium]